MIYKAIPWAIFLGQPGRNRIPLKPQQFSSHIRMKLDLQHFWEKGRILQSEPLLKIITRRATSWGLSLVTASFRRGSEIQISHIPQTNTKFQALQGIPNLQTRKPGATAIVAGSGFQGALKQSWCQDYRVCCRTDTDISLLRLYEAEKLQRGFFWGERETFTFFFSFKKKIPPKETINCWLSLAATESSRASCVQC